MNYIVEAGDFDILVGNSSRDEDLKNVIFNVENVLFKRLIQFYSFISIC